MPLSATSSQSSPAELERQVQVRTGRRVHNLAIELEPERVVMHGQATSYYVKQLAQQSIQDLMPHLRVDNAIIVETR